MPDYDSPGVNWFTVGRYLPGQSADAVAHEPETI